MKVTRLNILETIWRELATDRGFHKDVFLSHKGQWVEEDFDSENPTIIVLREATEEEKRLGEAMDILESAFSEGRAYQEVEF